MELQQFGWNLVTIGFLGTIFFTFFESWGYYHQAIMIWKNRSGQSVSIIAFAYLATVFASLLIYGLSTGRIAAIFNGGVLAILHLPILVGLWKFKGYSRLEKFSAVGLISVLVAMVILPYKGEFFLAICFGSLVTLVAQPLEIINNRSAGDVEPKLYVMLVISTSFWIIYAYAINDLPLMIICPISLIIFGTTLYLAIKDWSNPRPS